MSELRDKVADIIEWGGSNFIGSMPSAEEDADEIIRLITNNNRVKAVEAVNQLPDPFDYDDVIKAINKALGGSDE